MTFDSSNPSLRDTTIRKGEFREVARDILRKDRDSRKYGVTVDTGGSITRALENAYKLGVAHGKSDAPQIQHSSDEEDPDAPLAWLTIPPRCRGIYESICRYDWLVVQRGGQWACYWVNGEQVQLAHAYSASTLAPLIKLGLMQGHIVEKDILLCNTVKGALTWKAAIEAGNVRAD